MKESKLNYNHKSKQILYFLISLKTLNINILKNLK